MFFWKPIVQRRRQKQSLIQIVGTKSLSHQHHLKTDAHSSKRFCRTRESIPDTLLEERSLFAFLTASALTLAMAALSWKFIEKPLLNLKRFFDGAATSKGRGEDETLKTA